MTIKVLLFDLGGVLLDINYEKTTAAFAELLHLPSSKAFYSKLSQDQLFPDFERGTISEQGFRKRLRDLSGKKLSDRELDTAWNAMLGDFQLNKIEHLEHLQQDYVLGLFSNTNSIHKTAFDKILDRQIGKDRFDKCFEHQFYSHLIGLRKPDVEAFDWVVAKLGVPAGEVLFVDDHPDNISGAKNAGLQVLKIESNEPWFEKLKELL